MTNQGAKFSGPGTPRLEIPEAEQAERLKELRRHRYGDWGARHVLILCARGFNPTVSAKVWLCARTNVDRLVEAYLKGTLDSVTRQEVSVSHCEPRC